MSPELERLLAPWRRQVRANLVLSWTLVGAILLGFPGIGWVTDGWQGVLGGLFMLVAAGGMAWGYLAAYLVGDARGLVPTPKQPWTVEVQGERLRLQLGSDHAWLELGAITHAVWLLQEDDFDRLRSLEDALDLHLGEDRIVVPESAEGFLDLVGALNARNVLEKRVVV